MNSFEFIVAIVLISGGVNLAKSWMNRRDGALKRDEGPLQDLAARLERMEKRMANIETIVLDREKLKEFDSL
jgi:hypothetical protein